MEEQLLKLLNNILVRESNKVDVRDEEDKLAYYIGRKELAAEILESVKKIVNDDKYTRTFFRKMGFGK